MLAYALESNAFRDGDDVCGSSARTLVIRNKSG